VGLAPEGSAKTMPYTKEQQKRHERIYGQLAALRQSTDMRHGSRKSTTIDGVTVTAVYRGYNFIMFEADQFTGAYAMSLAECAEYMTTRPGLRITEVPATEGVGVCKVTPGRYECPDLECGVVFTYLRICLGKAVPPTYCPQCGGSLEPKK
jgi:hypothetical protein